MRNLFHPLKIQTLKDFMQWHPKFGEYLGIQNLLQIYLLLIVSLFTVGMAFSNCFARGRRSPYLNTKHRSRLTLFWRFSSKAQIVGNALPCKRVWWDAAAPLLIALNGCWAVTHLSIVCMILSGQNHSCHFQNILMLQPGKDIIPLFLSASLCLHSS